MREKVRPVKHAGIMPTGGLWTSTWTGGKTISAWASWTRNFDDFSPKFWVTLIEPVADAKILEIDSFEDLREAHDQFPAHRELWRPPFDIEIMAGLGYDAVHLTENGYDEMMATWLRTELSLVNWEVESTFWMNWSFARTVELGTVTLVDVDLPQADLGLEL